MSEPGPAAPGLDLESLLELVRRRGLRLGLWQAEETSWDGIVRPAQWVCVLTVANAATPGPYRRGQGSGRSARAAIEAALQDEQAKARQIGAERPRPVFVPEGAFD